MFVCFVFGICATCTHHTHTHRLEEDEEEQCFFFVTALFLVLPVYLLLLGDLNEQDSLNLALTDATGKLEKPRHAYASIMCDDSMVSLYLLLASSSTYVTC